MFMGWLSGFVETLLTSKNKRHLYVTRTSTRVYHSFDVSKHCSA